LGGVQGRVIYFRTDDGSVWLRRLRASEALAANEPGKPLLEIFYEEQKDTGTDRR